MAKNHKTSGNGKIEKGGYRPLNEGYSPTEQRGYVPSPQAGRLPKAPLGGTGQSPHPSNTPKGQTKTK
jgi:hypothetical protein